MTSEEGLLTLKCKEHGDREIYAAALCLHIATGWRQGLHQSYRSYQARPDAWCNHCELTRLKEGEWNERCDAFAGFKVLCCYCYDDQIDANDGPQLKLEFLKKCIALRGWRTVKNYGDDKDIPSSFYTIGLTSKFNHPEIFVSGLSRGLLDHVVEDFANRISNGQRFGDGDLFSDLVGDTQCCLRTALPQHFPRYMPQALEILESASSALQCVWPDQNNKYPWDEGFSVDMRHRQPALWQAPADS